LTTATIQRDVDTSGADHTAEFDPADVLLKGLLGGEEPTEQPTKGKHTEATETPSEEEVTTEETEPAEGEEEHEDPEDNTEESTEDKPTADRRQAADEDEVVVQVGDEALRVSVKDLKRLFGQEAALTKKGQEIAETKRTLEADAQKYAVAVERAAKEAAERWQDYEKIDYLLAKDGMTPEAFAQLRSDAQKAWQTHQFYQKEVGEFAQKVQQERVKHFREAAEKARTELTTPTSKSYIKDFNEGTYKDMLAFAETLGASREVVQSITEPWAIKVLHMAMQQSKAAATTLKAKPVIKAAAPTVPKSSDTNVKSKADPVRSTRARLAQTGDISDAADAFLAGWGVTGR
jgi:hypothetical protein